MTTAPCSPPPSPRWFSATTITPSTQWADTTEAPLHTWATRALFFLICFTLEVRVDDRNMKPSSSLLCLYFFFYFLLWVARRNFFAVNFLNGRVWRMIGSWRGFEGASAIGVTVINYSSNFSQFITARKYKKIKIVSRRP